MVQGLKGQRIEEPSGLLSQRENGFRIRSRVRTLIEFHVHPYCGPTIQNTDFGSYGAATPGPRVLFMNKDRSLCSFTTQGLQVPNLLKLSCSETIRFMVGIRNI